MSSCCLRYLPLIHSWSTLTSHCCMGWCWKWQWRARRLLWLQPTLNWRMSCLTRRLGFLSGIVQSDLRERAALWTCCQQGVQPHWQKEWSQRFLTLSEWDKFTRAGKPYTLVCTYLSDVNEPHSRANYAGSGCTWMKLQTWVKDSGRRLFTLWRNTYFMFILKC